MIDTCTTYLLQIWPCAAVAKFVVPTALVPSPTSVPYNAVGRGLPAATVLLNIGRRHWIISQYDRKSSLSRILDLFRRRSLTGLLAAANWVVSRTCPRSPAQRGPSWPRRANINLISFSLRVGRVGHVVSGARSVQTPDCPLDQSQWFISIVRRSVLPTSLPCQQHPFSPLWSTWRKKIFPFYSILNQCNKCVRKKRSPIVSIQTHLVE